MRKLTLRKEALAALTTDELSAVGGAGPTFITDACVTGSCTGVMCLFTDVICFEQ